MPFLLRKVRKSKWYSRPDLPWLLPGELQADTLSDLATKDNALSVYLIQDDLANLERVIAALAASGSHVSIIDYALLNSDVARRLGFELISTPGTTPDRTVNIELHLEFAHLTAGKLATLAEEIRKGSRIERVLDKRTTELVAKSIRSGHIEASVVNEDFLLSLQKNCKKHSIALS